MSKTLPDLIQRLDSSNTFKDIIAFNWAPIPAFGDHTRAKVATLGLNPSNLEFVDNNGKELDGSQRRFHTLKSLEISEWSEVQKVHLQLITDSCKNYFSRNPYNFWFKPLNEIIAGLNASYYNYTASHLDLVPYATTVKWAKLSSHQRGSLLEFAGDSLGLILRESPIRLLIVNGQGVINNLQKVSGVIFQREPKTKWALSRNGNKKVMGYSFKGVMKMISKIDLNKEVFVLGFSHNIQSSFGVTGKVRKEIQNWVSKTATELLSE